jgi:hypothetical protein
MDAFNFMHAIATNKRASDESLPPREEEHAPLSPLALLSSVATSWENSNDAVPSQRRNSMKNLGSAGIYSCPGMS